MNTLPGTAEFITAETNYLASHMSEIRGLLKANGPVTMIHSASDATLACRIDDVELGQVTSGEGYLLEPGAVKYADLVTKLEAPSAN